MKHILVAEDDPNILEGLATLLASEGYDVATAKNGAEALEKFRRRKPDLLLLDVMMPEKSGYDVCRELRATDTTTPVIMLTAKGEELDKVLGLTLGADDYVTKPFGVRELLARVAAVLRRGKSAPLATTTEIFEFAGLSVDPRRYCVVVKGKEISLSDRELKLIVFMHAHPGEVLTRDQLLNAVWGINYFGNTRTLDQHIAQLRKKLGSAVIETVHGIGYRVAGQG